MIGKDTDTVVEYGKRFVWLIPPCCLCGGAVFVPSVSLKRDERAPKWEWAIR